MDDLGAIFSLNNWPGHLSYVLIAISYWLTDMFWLRAVAVIGLSLEILYFWLSGGDLRTGIGWDLIFIAINLYQIYRLMKDRLSLRLPEPDRELLRSVLSGLDDSQIARLLVAGEFCDIADGTTLATENQPLERIFFIGRGPRQRHDHWPSGRAFGTRQLRRRSRFPDGKAGHGDSDCRRRCAGARL